jgi:hypothetical protein
MPVDLVNLTAERTRRRPPEYDQRCRDCGKLCNDLAHLVDHYAFECRPHHE